jgi:hypothetical protein
MRPIVLMNQISVEVQADLGDHRTANFRRLLKSGISPLRGSAIGFIGRAFLAIAGRS